MEDGRGWRVGTVGVGKKLGLDGGLHAPAPDAAPTRGLREIAVGVAALAGTGGGKGGRRREPP
ncbi:hypothetical protein [Streptomyces sp. NPDC056468]|uniref:hypothetical protein n=1 Tax=unclassified Streptomyces TaxID=2593676 RepID=UPI0036D20559